MRCGQARILMMKQLCDGAAPEEQRAVTEHLERCAACAEERRALAGLTARLSQERPLPTPGASGWPPSREAILKRRPNPWIAVCGCRPRSGWAWAAGSAVIAAVLAVAFPRLQPFPLVGSDPQLQNRVQSAHDPGNPRQPGMARPAHPLAGHAGGTPPGDLVRKDIPAVTAKRHGPTRRTADAPRKPARAQPDLEYLDGYDPAVLARWVVGSEGDPELRRLLDRELAEIRVKDDFVEVPLPRLASAAPQKQAVREAVRQYEKEAAVVDTRLFRKISLRLKQASLSEFCETLEQQTGVKLQVARSVADENVTVLVKEKPAREVMRAVARLFGYKWSRSGTEGSYKYELYQDLRSQLAEEEMRNRDLNAALVALDDEMAQYLPYVDRTVDELQGMVANAVGSERQRLRDMVQEGAWAAVQIYHRLTPAERLALMSTRALEFRRDASNPAQRLPVEWHQSILQSYGKGVTVTPSGVRFGGDGGRLVDVPDASASVTLQLNRSELGQLTLESNLNVRIPLAGGGEAGTGLGRVLATGRSPSVAKPDNAVVNRELERKPPFQNLVSIRPTPSCPRFAPSAPKDEREPPHVTTADVWESVHSETGLPIVADSYTRILPAMAVTVERVAFFEALCRISDTVGARWTRDGEFLFARSTSYFWEKQKEVPKWWLRRWQSGSHGGSLKVDSVLEMGGLPDPSLDSQVIAEAVRHCWGLQEWGIPADAHLRPYVRFLAALAADQRKQAASTEGLFFGNLTPEQQRLLLTLLRAEKATYLDATHLALAQQAPQGLPSDLRHELDRIRRLRIHFAYAPAGHHTWEASDHSHVVIERTAEKALELARRIDPTAVETSIRRSKGNLWINLLFGDGSVRGRCRDAAWASAPKP